MSDTQDLPHFIEDGHQIVFGLDRDTIKVVEVVCPHDGTTSICNRRRNYCAVARFIHVYGVECNVGQALITGKIDIAWCGIPGDSDIDIDLQQIWFTPVTDVDYQGLKKLQEDDQTPQ